MRPASLTGVSVIEFLKVFCRILFEFWDTGITAKFDFLSFVIDDDRIAHRPEFFTRDEAGFKRVGLGPGFGCRCCIGAFLLVTRSRGEGDDCEWDKDDLHRGWGWE